MKHTLILLIILLLWPAALHAQENCRSDEIGFGHHMEQAGLLRGRGNPAAAVAEYGCAIQLQPGNPLPYRGRGNAYLSMGIYESAVSDFGQMIGLSPDDPVGYNNRGYTYYLMGYFEEALRDFNHALELDPDYARAVNNRGLVYLQTTNYAAAITDFMQAIELGYDPPYGPYENLGRTYMAMGSYNDAHDYLQEAIRLAPTFAEGHRLLGEVFEALGQLDKAVVSYRIYVDLAGSGARPRVLDFLAGLETRSSLVHFLPSLLLGGIVLYIAGAWLWTRFRRKTTRATQPTRPAAGAPATSPPAENGGRRPLLLALPLALLGGLAVLLAARRRE